MRLLCVLSLFLACGLSVFAGPPFPCVRAVSSKNGSFLVLADPYVPGQKQFTLLVLRKETFINAPQRLVAPVTYWAGSPWSVVVDGDPMRNEPEPCLLPLISDDGEFLIIVHVGPTFSGDAAVLRIYRRRDHLGDPIREGPDHGVFIKEITLSKVWPPNGLAAIPLMWTDHTPEWFSGGTFDFSSDNRQLIHKTRWGNTVHINLADGSLADK